MHGIRLTNLKVIKSLVEQREIDIDEKHTKTFKERFFGQSNIVSMPNTNMGELPCLLDKRKISITAFYS